MWLQKVFDREFGERSVYRRDTGPEIVTICFSGVEEDRWFSKPSASRRKELVEAASPIIQAGGCYMNAGHQGYRYYDSAGYTGSRGLNLSRFLALGSKSFRIVAAFAMKAVEITCGAW